MNLLVAIALCLFSPVAELPIPEGTVVSVEQDGLLRQWAVFENYGPDERYGGRTGYLVWIYENGKPSYGGTVDGKWLEALASKPGANVHVEVIRKLSARPK